MEALIKQINKILKSIDFNAIWSGFSPCAFALYDSETVCFHDRKMPWDERFSGNTVIKLDGVPVAIWHVENLDDIDIERLASNIVHEMFRAFQHEQGDERYIDEFALLDYPYDLDNLRLRAAENHYLIKAITDNSMMDLQQFIVLREARRRIIGDIMMQEQRAETLEGMAEYAGLIALNQISREKFMEDFQKHISRLRNPQNMLKIRLVSYSVGCLICFALKSLGIDFYHNLSDSRTIYEFIPHEPSEIETILAKSSQERQARFDNFLENNRERTEYSGQITGFDPMNMEKLGNKILCTNFVMLGKMYIKGPVMLETATGEVRQVVAYTK